MSGDVLAALDQQLGRARRDTHLDAAAVRLVDDLEQASLVEPGVRDDQLVEACAVASISSTSGPVATSPTNS